MPDFASPGQQAITLTLFNRKEVMSFINGEFHPAYEPDDLGSDVVIVELIDRRAVVILGETVTRSRDEFTIGHDGKTRDRFPRIAPRGA